MDSHALAAPAAITLTPTDKGITVDAGPMGQLAIADPVLRKADRAVVPLVSRTPGDGGTVAFKFYDDTVIIVKVDAAAKSVNFDYATHSDSAKTIQLNTKIPFTLREGATATVNGATVPFPMELPPGPDGSNIWRGETTRIAITTALGQILAVEAPRNFQQLQDNRFWNNNRSFVWIYNHDLLRDKTKTSFTLQFSDVAVGAAPPVQPKQLVDRFGQSTLVNYPTKITSEDQLTADAAADAGYYGGFKTGDRDSYGGLAGSGAKFGLKSTGYFHVEKINLPKLGEKPVLVDPNGNLFFQLGLCSMGHAGDSYTYVSGRSEIYEWLPEKQGTFATAYRDGGSAFSFYAANWIRKNGKPWDDKAVSAQSIERARQLGFNSAGSFSVKNEAFTTANFAYVSKLPFTGLDVVPDTKRVIDPFADGAADKLLALFRAKVAPLNDDKLLIGNFLGNEQFFETIPKVVPGLDGKSGAKRRLVSLLQEKYGDIGKFNAAWEMKPPAASFEALADTKLFVVTQAASEDVNIFFGLFMDEYYRLISETYRQVCPNHILLGNRWLSSTANTDQIVKSAGKYLDVLSINYYTYAIEPVFLKRVHDLSGGKPILLSEWHFSSADEGLSGGAREVKGQHERGLAYRNYVEQAASLGFIVGHEWFSYLDQPVTGRWFEKLNGEKGNIGLVDVADRPYKDFLSEAAKTNSGIYDVLLRKTQPFAYNDGRFAAGGSRGPKTVQIARALPGMTINGIQDNWPQLPAEQITAANLVTGVDATGFSGDFRLAWDDDNLYLYIQVKDPTPMVNDNPANHLWTGDCVTLFIGPDNLTTGGSMQFGDRQVLLSARKGEGGYRYYFNNAPGQGSVNMEVVKNVAGDGYSLEAAIPFAALGFKPKENQELLFDLSLNDATAGRRELVWNGSARNSGDRGAWGRARLVR